MTLLRFIIFVASALALILWSLSEITDLVERSYCTRSPGTPAATGSLVLTNPIISNSTNLRWSSWWISRSDWATLAGTPIQFLTLDSQFDPSINMRFCWNICANLDHVCERKLSSTVSSPR